MTRGAQRVGLLEDLNDVERLAVRWLRHWERDPEGQAALQNSLGMALGPERARNVSGVFADLMQVGHQFGRRPLCRHGLYCNCLGADEAVFAHLIEAASNGENEDAALLASLIVRPDMALCFSGLAAEFGIALAAFTRAVPKPKRRPVPKRPSLKAETQAAASHTLH
ncbi:hypothetical protein J7399_15845 [Shimia sp. R9_1]|uniref:hypothetical protein n=1 Tax=unclassified Shimia TaxID=2630038 RepID=UPI001ADA8118|nr:MULTISPECIES: hypothetical protein [unclassified Shimia]MBO9398907.1 hypothetical protein [Shimia sp. R9_2]MBO9408910.1 hypothetical protein [Shimia sp. R9_1]